MDRYYDTTLLCEWLAEPGETAPVLPGDVVILPPEHIFWQPLPEGDKLVYGLDGVPTGYETVVPTPEYALFLAVTGAGLTRSRLVTATYAASRGYPGPLNDFNAEVDALALTEGVTVEDIIEAMG